MQDVKSKLEVLYKQNVMFSKCSVSENMAGKEDMP